MREKSKKHFKVFYSHFSLALILIIIIGVFLRFIFLQNIILAGDNSRDVMISQVAIQKGELPMIGPFSSAGPFVTGPLYFWTLMLGNLLLPFGIYSAWYFFFIISMITLLMFIKIGHLIAGKRLAIIFGLLSASSLELVSIHLNVGNPTLVIIWITFLLLNFVLYVQKKKIIYVFLAGLSLGFGLNMHYQALNLLLFFPALFMITGISWLVKIKSFFLFLIGSFIPLLPLIVWDSQQGFSNFHNIIDYFLVGQYRIYVPNSWTIFLFNDMPVFFGKVVGGSKQLGFFTMLLIALAFLVGIYNIKTKKIKQEVYLIAGIFSLMLFLNRYYHGQRSEVYLLYLLPFILFFSCLSFEFFLNLSKRKIFTYTSYMIIGILVISNFIAIFQLFYTQKSNIVLYENAIAELQKRYPNQAFSVYDNKGQFTGTSLPLSLVMSSKKIQSPNGKKILVGCVSGKECNFFTKVADVPLIDIDKKSKKEMMDYNNVNRLMVYESLIGWSKKHSLTHTFDFGKYLKERVSY